MMGLMPTRNVPVPVGVEQVPAPGLQTPIVTLPGAESGRSGSALPGTVIVKTMVVELITAAAIFESGTINPPLTTPTLVFAVNPEPEMANENDPLVAGATVPGEMLLMVADGDMMFKFTTTSIWLLVP